MRPLRDAAIARLQADQAAIGGGDADGAAGIGADGSVDTLVLHQVLHFADDPAAVLGEAARLLAPGGKLLIIDFMPHKREELRERQRHVRLGFGDAQVIDWLAAAGLSGRVAAQLPPPAGADDRALGVSLWLGTRDAKSERKAA